MLCDVCQQPASEQCPLCGICLCADHGGPVCFRCAAAARATDEKKPNPRAGIYTSDRWGRRVWKKSYLQCESRHHPETVYVEDPGPPSCHECGALARKLCRHCQQLFCPDHAGGPELCRRCAHSSLIGMVILASIGVFWTAMLLLAH